MCQVISDQQRMELKAKMPELLEKRLGVTNLRGAFRCPSPHHEDKNPSARYHAPSQSIHCFGCGATWDVFSLVGMLDGISGFKEQATQVARDTGYILEDASCIVRGSANIKSASTKPAFAVPKSPNMAVGRDTASEMWDALFSEKGEAARAYLRSRGISDEHADHYMLGFATRPQEYMPEFKVFEPASLGFIMIPFYGETALEPISYCIARTICHDAPTHKEWRPAGAVPILWHEWLLRSGAPVVYVAEGIFDAMAIEILTGKPCIALCGTGGASRLSSVLYYTPFEARPKSIVIAPDQDEAGLSCARKISHDLRTLGIPHGIMQPYPNGAKDANEWLVSCSSSNHSHSPQNTIHPLVSGGESK